MIKAYICVIICAILDTTVLFRVFLIMKTLLLKHLGSYDSWLGAMLIAFGLLLQANAVDPLVALTWLAWGFGSIKLLRSHNS